MGKITTFVVGLLILGASQGVTYLNVLVSDVVTPIDYAALIQYASTGLMYLGAIIVGYALITGVLSIFLHNHRRRKEINRQEAEERRHRERLEDRGLVPKDQPSPEQDYPQEQYPNQQYEDERDQEYYNSRRRQY